MDFSRRTAQLLHEEHRATIAMMEDLESLIARAKRTTPDAGDPHVRQILDQVNLTVEHNVGEHFAFEEKELFTRLADFGDAEIGEHLTQEHQAMLPIAQQLAHMATEATNGEFNDENWAKFKTLTGELIERMLAHIQKEEMALLPMLEELLDPESDMELAEIYSMNQ